MINLPAVVRHTTKELIGGREMFNDIEGKIKGLAIVNLVCGIILAVVLFFSAFDYAPLIGLAMAVPCLLLALFGSWVIYAFGELLENTKKARKTLEEMERTLKIANADELAKARKNTSYWKPND